MALIKALPIQNINDLNTFNEKNEQTLIRYILLFGGFLAFYGVMTSYFSLTFFESNWYLFLAPTGIMYLTAVGLVIRNRQYLNIAITLVILASHINVIGMASLAGHWANLAWIVAALTLLIQQVTLRERPPAIRYLLWLAIMIEFASVAILQEQVFNIKPVMPNGERTEAWLSVSFFIFYFIILEVGYSTDNNLINQLVNSLRDTNNQLNEANNRVTAVNQQLQDQKAAFLAIFEAQARLKTYVDAYLSDLEHETGNSLNPILANMDMVSTFRKEDNIPYNQMEDDLDRVFAIGVPRIRFASQYISDARLHLSSAMTYVSDAATSALQTRSLEDSSEAIEEMTQRASRIGQSFYAAESTFDVEDMRDRLNTIRNGRLSRDVNLEAHIHVDHALDGKVTYPLAIRTIVTNLFVNAIKYSKPNPNGEKTKTVNVRLETDDDQHMTITVADEGVGIPDDVLPNIFDFGSRSAAHAKSQYGGGVGMWLVKQIVDASDGTIDIDTSPAGTTITVRLPIFEKQYA